MKRTLLRLGLLGLLGLLGFLGFLWLTMPNHRINRATCDKIAKGMSLQEVQSLLRCPPGNYCSSSAMVECQLPDGSPSGIAVDEICESIRRDGLRETFWASDNGVIVVLLDSEGKVEDKQFANMYAEGFFAKARRWLASIL
jgi:hypothetical protein